MAYHCVLAESFFFQLLGSVYKPNAIPSGVGSIVMFHVYLLIDNYAYGWKGFPMLEDDKLFLV